MKQYTITLTLLEDVIISQRSASLGGHRSLDYVPGAVLLGACAGRLYKDAGTQAYRLFHSGKVRFGNALPLSEAGQLGMPMPLVWFYKKGGSYQIKQGSGRQLLDVDKISQHDNDNGEQPVQLRSGYLTGDLEVLKPMQTLRMKTAIDPDTARAATSQLFGYQALEAGQRFRATLSADDDVLELAERAAEALQGTLLLGRSRSAQYGKAGCEVGEAHNPPDLDSRLLGAKQLKLWLQADMVLQDEFGRPLLHGRQADLPADLSGAQINWRDSQLRFRRYSPYNGARRSFDLERQAIEKGSVLAVKLAEPLDQRQWQALQAGLGLYRESGLGQVLADHDLIDSDRIKTIKSFEDRITLAEAPKQPDSALAKWIQAGVSAHADLDKDKTLAEQSIEALAGLYQRARAYHGIEAHLPIGPTASQWSLVVEAGKRHQRNKEALLTTLFDADNGICKDGDESWGIATLTAEGREIKFADWLKQALGQDGLKNPAYVASLIARMGAEYVKAQKKGAHDDA